MNEGSEMTHKAIAYYRTSSASAVEGDSEARQREAVVAYARSAGLEIIGEHYDAAVSGTDAVTERPGFRDVLAQARETGVTKVLVENASRFSRDLIIQEVGLRYLRKQGIEIVAVDSPAAFIDDGPATKLIRQVLGAVSEFERTMLVLKLKGARERTGHFGGRPKLAAAAPEACARAKEMTGSLRSIARQLAIEGFVSSSGAPFTAKSVKKMIEA
jgi:DNA invertase Pin-like site-specific DNA recombinase